MNLFELKDKVDGLIQAVGGDTQVVVENVMCSNEGGDLFSILNDTDIKFRSLNEYGEDWLTETDPYTKETISPNKLYVVFNV